jgi:glutamate 5-kinase
MRIVLKLGSGILATQRGNTLDSKQFLRLAKEIAALFDDGHECIVVSSGAVAAGLGALGFTARPEDLPSRQACAAVGQSKLMQKYSESFKPHDLQVAQVLLTHGDIDSKTRCENVRTTLGCILQRRRVVPIINENDTVATEELRFGDNDRLSAEVAMLLNADILILLTSVDGLLNSSGKRISEVHDVDSVSRFARNDKGRLSVGGMVSKLQAVKLAVDSGITTYIASGRKAGQMAAILAGKNVGTRFAPPTQGATKKSK